MAALHVGCRVRTALPEDALATAGAEVGVAFGATGDRIGNDGRACVGGEAARCGGSGSPACARRCERSSTSAWCSCRLGTPESSEP